jgi:non-specific serine/threonine protein kinase
VLSLKQLAARLDDRFAVPLSGNRGLLPQHKTMRAAVDWSFELCAEQERTLWTRVSVFVDSFDATGAEWVAHADDLPVDDVLPTLAGLVDKSVLLADDHEGARRFRLLETLRQYGLDRLGAPARVVLRRRHRDFYLDLAERFDADWYGPRQTEWTRQMLVELPNLREALAFCLSDPAEVRYGVQMAGALYLFWQACGETREGRHWLEQVLAADPQPRRERVRALAANARLLLILGLPQAAADVAQECVDLACRYQALLYVSDAQQTLGLARLFLGDPSARSLLEQATTTAAQLGPAHRMVANAKFCLSVAVLMDNDCAGADELLVDAMAICRGHDDPWGLGVTLNAAIAPAMRLGAYTRAEAYGRESLRCREGLQDLHGTVSVVEMLAWVAGAAGEHVRAARLLGAADRQWPALGGSPFDAGQWLHERQGCIGHCRQAIGSAAFEAELRRGHDLTLDEAVAFALREGQPPVGPQPPSIYDSPLTRRERQIAELVAEGLTDRQIANRLVISRRTAESHVANILTKLDFKSRTQIASWQASRRRLDEAIGPFHPE